MPIDSRALARPALAAIFVAALGLTPAPVFPAPLEAAASPNDFQPSGFVGEFNPAVSLDGAAAIDPVTVIVTLKDPPLGINPNGAAALAQSQNAARAAIAAQGGTVTMQYQYALNGFAVQIARGNVGNLANLAGVSAVTASHLHEPDNSQSVPFLGAPAVWDGLEGFHGEGIKIGVIDTGLDYTHANFGGPGTAAAYAAAHAAETAPADPTLFGPTSGTKVKGGTDLVGDAYDASSSDPAINTPHPDPNPLDCNGHGSHVGGTAAGFGVTDSGATYSGPYDATTPSRAFRIGPGMAPRADLYAIRVFGCAGSASTPVVIAGIDWAVAHHMDVVNMSLGSPFGSGSEDDAEIEAANNAGKAGTLVIASAGNNGGNPYITGRPASAPWALSVAAIDSKLNFPGANVALSIGSTIVAIDANGAALPAGSLPIMVLRDTGGNVSLGCADTDYPSSVAGRVLVTRRGVCARVDRATLAQKHGAAAALMLNTDAGYPPFEGAIDGVTIPFLGVRGVLGTATSDATLVAAADGGSVTLSAANVPNPTARALAGFTSGGPRFGDSFLKPEVSAPGVSIASTGSGTGNGAAVLSGTSMAAPHVTGLAALVLQSHPSFWSPQDLKQAIVNTASPGGVASYSTRIGGAGLVSAPNATKTVAVAFGNSDQTSLSFGFQYDAQQIRNTGLLLVRNHGPRSITFNLSEEFSQGPPHTLSFESTALTVPAFGHGSLNVTLDVPPSTIGNASAFRDVAGIVKLTPVGDGNNGIALRVPYYVVPRALANVQDALVSPLGPTQTTSQVRVTNGGGAIAGTADFYAWGLVDSTPLSRPGKPFELRSEGVRSFTDSTGQQRVVFAVSTRGRFSNAAPYRFSTLVRNESGQQFEVFSGDVGLLTAGTADGRVGAFVRNRQTNAVTVDFLANAPNNGNTLLLPVLASRLALTAAAPRFDYTAFSFDRGSTFVTPDSQLPGQASFNAFANAISTSQFVTVPPGGSALVDVALNPVEAQRTPARGLMIVSLDNNTDKGAQVELLSVAMPAPATSVQSLGMPLIATAVPASRPPTLNPAR